VTATELMSKIEERRSEAAGFDIRYFVAGQDGPPVVLLHGGGIDSALLSWREAIAPLAASYRVWAPDWPGYGGSPLPADGQVTQSVLLRCLMALLDAWELDRAALVGLSMGGGAALGAALEHPERVSRLALVGSYGLQDKMPLHALSVLIVRMGFLNQTSWTWVRSSRSAVRWALSSIMKNPAALTDALVDEMADLIRSTSTERAWTSFQADEAQWQGTRTCYMARLGEVRCPTLIVHGSQDSLAPLRYAQQAAERIPGAQLHVIEGCGHWVPRDWPEEFNRTLIEFLRETDS